LKRFLRVAIIVVACLAITGGAVFAYQTYLNTQTIPSTVNIIVSGDFEVESATLDFGDVARGITSDPQTLSIHSLTGESLAIWGSGADSDFQFSWNAGAPVDPATETLLIDSLAAGATTDVTLSLAIPVGATIGTESFTLLLGSTLDALYSTITFSSTGDSVLTFDPVSVEFNGQHNDTLNVTVAMTTADAGTYTFLFPAELQSGGVTIVTTNQPDEGNLPGQTPAYIDFIFTIDPGALYSDYDLTLVVDVTQNS
jgi:hypothetical protein